MSDVVIQVDHLSKKYHLGQIGGKRLVDDVNRWWARIRGKEDPLSKIDFAPRPQPSAPSPELPAPRSEQSASADLIWALRDVSFEVKQSEVLGIIGRNGAGKSTLLKILSRVTAPTSGEVRVKGRIASLLEVGTGFHPELTGRENIFLNGAILGMTKFEIRKKFDEIVNFAEIEKFIDTPVKRYSSGMYVRLAFAVAAHLEPEILIVDEVLAVGDASFQKKCLGKMHDVARAGRTVLFVSHNLVAISQLCTSGLLIQNGTIFSSGNTASVLETYTAGFYESQDNETAEGVLKNLQLSENTGSQFYIKEIRILDRYENPKPVIQTWDFLILRVVFFSPMQIKRGAVELEIRTLEGVRLIRLASLPDRGFPIEFIKGIQSVDCLIDSIPLSAGGYILGASLTIPEFEWLYQRPEFAQLTVAPRDVYDSGRAPAVERCLVATSHCWKTS